MNDSFREEIFYSINGLLIRVSTQNFDNTRSIELKLEQFEFNNNSKSPTLLNTDTFNYTLEKQRQKNVQLLLKKTDNKFQNLAKNESSQGFTLQTRLVNENGAELLENSYKIIAVTFNAETSNFEFDPFLSSSLTHLTNSLEKKNLTFKVLNRGEAFVFHLEQSKTEFLLNVTRQVGAKTAETKRISLMSNLNADELHCLKWLEINNDENDEDFLITRIYLLIAEIKVENAINLKCFYLDLSNETILDVDAKKLFDPIVVLNQLHEEVRVEKLHFFISKNTTSLDYELESIYLTDLSLKVNNEKLVAKGDCVLALRALKQNSTFLIFVKNGIVKFKIDLKSSFECVDLRFGYLVVRKRDEERTFKVYRLNLDEWKFVQELNQCEAVLYDCFMRETGNCAFLVIKDWPNGEVDLKSQFGASLMLEETRFEEIMQVEENEPNENNIKGDGKKCVDVLYTILESKRHLSELLLREASEEAKHKQSLIALLTSSTAMKLENHLPTLINFYSSNTKINQTKEDEEDGGVKLDLNDAWTSYFDQSFFFNFIFKNCSKEKHVEYLHGLFLPRNEFNELVNLEMKETFFKLDEHFNRNEKLTSLDHSLFDSLLLSAFDPAAKNRGDYFLLSLQLDQEQFNKILSNFPDGQVSFSLHLTSRYNYKTSIKFTTQNFSLRMNIFEHLAENLVDNRFLVSILSRRQSGSKLLLKLKCDQIDLGSLNETLIKDMRFESVYSDQSSGKSVLVMRKQSLLSDCICFTQPVHESISSSYLSVLSREENQLSAFLGLLNPVLKSKLKKSTVALDPSAQIENLLECLESEIDAKLDFTDVNSSNEKMDTETDEGANNNSDNNQTKLKHIFSLEKKTDQIIQSIFN